MRASPQCQGHTRSRRADLAQFPMVHWNLQVFQQSSTQNGKHELWEAAEDALVERRIASRACHFPKRVLGTPSWNYVLPKAGRSGSRAYHPQLRWLFLTSGSWLEDGDGAKRVALQARLSLMMQSSENVLWITCVVPGIFLQCRPEAI